MGYLKINPWVSDENWDKRLCFAFLILIRKPIEGLVPSSTSSFAYLFLRQGPNSLCSPGLPQICANPASDLQMLGFQTCVAMTFNKCLRKWLSPNKVLMCGTVWVEYSLGKSAMQR